MLTLFWMASTVYVRIWSRCQDVCVRRTDLPDYNQLSWTSVLCAHFPWTAWRSWPRCATYNRRISATDWNPIAASDCVLCRQVEAVPGPRCQRSDAGRPGRSVDTGFVETWLSGRLVVVCRVVLNDVTSDGCIVIRRRRPRDLGTSRRTDLQPNVRRPAGHSWNGYYVIVRVDRINQCETDWRDLCIYKTSQVVAMASGVRCIVFYPKCQWTFNVK